MARNGHDYNLGLLRGHDAENVVVMCVRYGRQYVRKLEILQTGRECKRVPSGLQSTIQML